MEHSSKQLLLGLHVMKTASKTCRTPYANAIRLSRTKYSINTAQIFVTNPRTGRVSITDADIQAVKDITDNGFPLLVHSSYTVGFDHRNVHRIDAVWREWRIARRCGAVGYVVHIVQALPDQIDDLIKVIITKNQTHMGEEDITGAMGIKCPVLLEPVGTKSSDYTYETPEKINNLIRVIKQYNWIGIVLDTAHIWASGTSLQSSEEALRFLISIEHSEKIRVIHLNGCWASRGIGRDVHTVPFTRYDYIWNSYMITPATANPLGSGCCVIVHFALVHNIPLIMEVNRSTYELLSPEHGRGGIMGVIRDMGAH